MTLEGWPKSLVFTADGLHLNFASLDEFKQWIAKERRAWNLVAKGAGNLGGAVNANVSLLNSVDSNPTNDVLSRVVNSYRPSEGLLGTFISQIPNAPVRCVAFGEIVNPNSTGQHTQNQPDIILGRALAAFYAAIGNSLIGISQARAAAQEIQAAVEEVKALRTSDKAVSDRFDALVTKCDADWASKIDGFEAKVALKAPRTFWQTRADQHSNRAVVARWEWFLSVLALVAFIVLAGGGEFFVPLPSDLAGAIVSGFTRLVLFATILAVAVWWLRQKLRDVRTHEHFAEDAAERATMIETYAALRGTGLQDADLGPILIALYRPAAGSLSEDQGPVLPTEIILRGVAAAASRAKS